MSTRDRKLRGCFRLSPPSLPRPFQVQTRRFIVSLQTGLVGKKRAIAESSMASERGGVQMKITDYGRGNVGGGLADLWERAGHEVTRLGRDGGDVSDAEVVLLAIPGGAVAEAMRQAARLRRQDLHRRHEPFRGGAAAGVRLQRGVRQGADRRAHRQSRSTSTSPGSTSNWGRAGRGPGNVWCGDDEAGRGGGAPHPRRGLRPAPHRHVGHGRAPGSHDAGAVGGQRAAGPLLLPGGAARATVAAGGVVEERRPSPKRRGGSGERPAPCRPPRTRTVGRAGCRPSTATERSLPRCRRCSSSPPAGRIP